MAFCSKCGKELAEGAQFCASCGAPVNGAAENDGTKRVQKFVGEIHKCPNCGAEIGSFQGVCPSCGFELNNSKVNNSVKEFFEKLQNIAEQTVTEFDKEEKNGLALVKIMLVLLVVMCLWFAWMSFDEGEPLHGCISILVGIVLLMIFLLFPYHATEIDKRKKTFIEGYVVPNDAESIMEFLLAAASQIDKKANPILPSGKEKLYWNKVWKVKVKQTIVKAKISLAGNAAVMERINAIQAELKSSSSK